MTQETQSPLIDLIVMRLAEPSTWRGITALCGAAGITLAPEYQNAIMTLVLSVIGLINVIRKEKAGRIINTTAPVLVTGGSTVETKS